MASSGHALLKGKKGIIFGALNDSSLAWHIAETAYREGGRFVLSNSPVVNRLGTLDALAEKTESTIIWADATDDGELEDLFQKTVEILGKLDFVVHSIGMGMNVRTMFTA